MPRVVFTQNIQKHVECPTSDVPGDTVRQALDHVFAGNPRARAYVLDDHGAVRKHMIVYVNGEIVADRVKLSHPLTPSDTVYVMQALSGG
ncbi:MAG: MoaD/ThiS family protein [Pirellulales bacterium]|jgi:molybdopterin synthase sulfur carrier subunit